MTDDERQVQIAGSAKAGEKITDEERQAEISGVCKKLGILPMNPPDVNEGPFEADMTKETDTTEQAAAPTPKVTINIDSGNDYDNDDKDEEDDNTLHPWTASKQGCENHPEESLFSDGSDDDHNENDHDENDYGAHYSESSYDEINKNKRPRRTPKSTIRTPKKTHW